MPDENRRRYRHKRVTMNGEQLAVYQQTLRQVESEKQQITAKALAAKARIDRIHRLVAMLKDARQKQGLSLTAISERSGLDKATLSRLENNINANPTLETLLKYADAIDVAVDFTVAIRPAA